MTLPFPLLKRSIWPSTLSAPETVHLAITTRCNLSCPGCYALQPSAGPELTPAELCGLIDQWSQMRIFQLAVGGGEPLLYEGLFEVLSYARQQGIVPNLTTNGVLLTAEVVRRLEEAGVSKVNLSWNGPGRPASLATPAGFEVTGRGELAGYVHNDPFSG